MKEPAEMLDVKEWYACDIPRQELKALMKKSDGPGLIYIGTWLILLVASGYLAYRLLGTFWAIPAFFLYGVIYSSCNSRWHECSHGTCFKTNWLNDFFYFVCGAMEFRDPVDFSWSHTRHHSYTLMTNIDPEIVSPRPPKMLDLILEFFAIGALLNGIKTLVMHSLGIPTQKVKEYVPEVEYDIMAWGARGVLAMHLAAVGLSIGFRSWLPVLYFTLARCYGAFFQWIFIMIQHVGRKENVWDHRICTRSLKVNPILSYLFMNMENHIEHHIYPTVPFHALPQLRERVKDQLPQRYSSMFAGFKEVASALCRQLKDPQYSEVPECGETYQPKAKESSSAAARGTDTTWHPVANVGDIEKEDLIAVNVNGKCYAVYCLADGYHATDGLCSHEQAPLADGLVQGDVIECPKHNARFHIPTGKVIRRPAQEDLATYPVKIDNDQIFIGLPQG